MKCANCGNINPRQLHDEGDTIYCTICHHRTRISDGKDDIVLCPVCHHMRDRKAYMCMWCNSPWGNDDQFSQEAFILANEYEKNIDSSNIQYFKLKGKRS